MATSVDETAPLLPTHNGQWPSGSPRPNLQRQRTVTFNPLTSIKSHQPLLSSFNSKLRRRNSHGSTLPTVQPPGPVAPRAGAHRTTKMVEKLKLLPNPETGEDGLDGESGRDVYAQFTRIKDPTARRDAARLGRADRERLPRVTAYCMAHGYRLDGIMRFMKGRSRTRGANPKLFDECLYSPYDYDQLKKHASRRDDRDDRHERDEHSQSPVKERLARIAPSARMKPDDRNSKANNIDSDLSTEVHIPEVFIFDYGTVVIWGMSPDREQRFLNDMSKFSDSALPPESVQTENFNFYYTKHYQARIYNDFISLRDPRNHMTKLAISHALSQSVKTSLFEDLVSETIDATTPLPAVIAETGSVNLTRRQLNMQIGELFILRINIHLQGSVLDSPELMWSEPHLEPVYAAVRSYLEIDQRVGLLTERLDVIAERLELLNDIDRFREHGLDNLPQIVVCGDTSSGKSSVLGALSGIPFPVSASICTRFATEISLRYSAAESVTGHAFITPAKCPSGGGPSGSESFRGDIASLDEIPALLDDARKAMRLGEKSGISRDVLHLRLDGKELPNLTLVDLPGLIHASRNADDIPMVQDLVEDYFKQERSIILVVVSAESPIDNQGILTSSRRFDPKGTRSIGVITKPDVLAHAEKASLRSDILELANNRNTAYQFTRGWHVVRCLDDKEREDGLDRDVVERALFDKEPWKTSMSYKQLGIASLRSALCKYLHQHILQVLPELQTSLERRLNVVRSSLDILGNSRTTPKERMRYLTRISQRYVELVKDALEGDYGDAFFQDGDPAKRLRATAMALTDEYELTMATKGHSFDIGPEECQATEKSPHDPDKITQAEALLKVGKLLQNYRGPELSFLLNPRVVGELFKDQSKKWPLLTSEYIGHICLAVQTFLAKLVDSICPSTGETSELIFRYVLDDALQSSFRNLESKADELFSPYTKSFLFPTKSRLQTSLKRFEHQDLQQEQAGKVTLPQQSSGPGTTASDHDTRLRLLQYSRAYYDVALETFIETVVILGVELCLLSKLQAMFTSDTVLQMDDHALTLVGGTPADFIGIKQKKLLGPFAQNRRRLRRIKKVYPNKW
ncbi:hypothetical protein DV737_g2428, partial [Chaetothyriales sp. CBS 132003]